MVVLGLVGRVAGAVVARLAAVAGQALGWAAAQEQVACGAAGLAAQEAVRASGDPQGWGSGVVMLGGGAWERACPIQGLHWAERLLLWTCCHPCPLPGPPRLRAHLQQGLQMQGLPWDWWRGQLLQQGLQQS